MMGLRRVRPADDPTRDLGHGGRLGRFSDQDGGGGCGLCDCGM
jgi:hypothetical protein